MTASRGSPSDADLARYLTGQSEPADIRAIEHWVAADAEHRRRLDDLRAIWQASEPSRPSWDAGRMWKRLADRLEQPPRPELVRDFPRFGASRFPYALIAASLAVVFAGGWYLSRAFAPSPAADRVVASASLVERRTGRGERVVFHLPDGTSVMLGPESRLRYSAAAYGRPVRALDLEGDGYFEVVHDAAHPFMVRAATARIRDLGTRFVVRARVGEARVVVGVVEGRVAVGAGVTPHDSVVLDRGDAAAVNPAGVPVVRRSADLDRYVAWTEGRLVFERTPLAVVVAELGRWYGVDITLAGRGLERRLLTAAFQDKPAAEALALIAASLDLAVSRNGSRFVLSGR